MGDLYAKGKRVLGSLNHALAVICNDKDGNKSNVQKELDGLQDRADAIDELSIYSTEEKIVGTWIDGNPIYRKVYTGTLDAELYTNIENNTEIANIINVSGQLRLPSNGSIVQLGCKLNANVYCGVYIAGSATLQIYNSSQLASAEYIAIIDYLK